jgi:hypothetical protein
VQYRRLREKPALIEMGILRLRDSASPLRENFETALNNAARASRA